MKPDKDDTIPTDVSQQQQNEKKDTENGEQPLSDRDHALLEIDDQLAAQTTTATVIDDEPLEKETSDSDKTTDKEPQLIDDLQGHKIRVKVGDKEEEKSLDSVVAELNTANGRVRKAAQRENELDSREKGLEEREKKLTEDPPSTETKVDDVDVDAQVKTVMSALLEGDEEAGTAALKTIITQGRGDTATPQIDKSEIVAEVKAEIKGDLAVDEAVKANGKDWDEFVETNPTFADEDSEQRQYGDYLFDTVFKPQVEAGEISYREALDKSAEGVAKLFTPESPNLDDDPEGGDKDIELSTREKKVERKDKIDNLRPAGSRAVKQPEQKETTESVLSEMAEMRGQPV